MTEEDMVAMETDKDEADTSLDSSNTGLLFVVVLSSKVKVWKQRSCSRVFTSSEKQMITLKIYYLYNVFCDTCLHWFCLCQVQI